MTKALVNFCVCVQKLNDQITKVSLGEKSFFVLTRWRLMGPREYYPKTVKSKIQAGIYSVKKLLRAHRRQRHLWTNLFCVQMLNDLRAHWRTSHGALDFESEAFAELSAHISFDYFTKWWQRHFFVSKRQMICVLTSRRLMGLWISSRRLADMSSEPAPASSYFNLGVYFPNPKCG